MWVERLQALNPDAGFAAPATEAAIRTCEERLGATLDGDLVALLRESNGVTGEYGLGLVWPVERIAADNLTFRTTPDFANLYMPFDPLVFFADAGNGDQFAFVLRGDRRDVFAWNHEDDSRTWVAPHLESYLHRWSDGTLTL